MSELRAAPYPADTGAKGWRFEIDYEKVEQSDTWSLAGEVPMARHALLMMWLMAWTQVPCGSMPNDEELIRVRCKVPPKSWAMFRVVLMRGWWLAADGRLYHDTIVERVLSMLSKKEKDRARKAGWRARQSTGDARDATGLPPESRGTDMRQTSESDRKDNTKHQAPVIPEEEKRDTPPASRVPPEPSARAAGKRALRKCPADFVVSLDLQVWAQDKAQGVDLTAETEKFRDWTFKTARTDWDGTWRNWMRKAAEDISSRVPAGAARGGPVGNRQEAQEERNRAAMASWLENEGVQQ